jgi:hypothetical protein
MNSALQGPERTWILEHCGHRGWRAVVDGAGPLLLVCGADREMLGFWLGTMGVWAGKFDCGLASVSTPGEWLNGEETWKGEEFDGVWILWP